MSFSEISKSILFASLTAGLMVAFAATQDASARVVIKKSETYYPVTGKNGAQIFKSFATSKHKLKNKHPFGSNYSIAATDFKIEIGKVQKTSRGGYCRITDAEIILNVEYTYPDWVDKPYASTNVRNEWGRFMDYVVWHENQHVKLAEEFSNDYVSLLQGTKFPLVANCTSLPKEVRKQRNKMHKAHLRQQKLFDRKESAFSGRGKKHLLALKRTK